MKEVKSISDIVVAQVNDLYARIEDLEDELDMQEAYVVSLEGELVEARSRLSRIGSVAENILNGAKVGNTKI